MKAGLPDMKGSLIVNIVPLVCYTVVFLMIKKMNIIDDNEVFNHLLSSNNSSFLSSIFMIITNLIRRQSSIMITYK
jgi:hypothetical protein